MDTSKEYILMCEKAEEIQQLRKVGKQFIEGDYFEAEGFRDGQSVGRCVLLAENCIICGAEFRSLSMIWLPRQDQLQAELGDFKTCLGHVWEYGEGIHELNENYPIEEKFLSMEQLWLAFVMLERYQKYWNGKNWVKK